MKSLPEPRAQKIVGKMGICSVKANDTFIDTLRSGSCFWSYLVHHCHYYSFFLSLVTDMMSLMCIISWIGLHHIALRV